MAMLIFNEPDIECTCHSLEVSHLLGILDRTQAKEVFGIRLCLLCSSYDHWGIGSCVKLRYS